jgi:hypothetical protein
MKMMLKFFLIGVVFSFTGNAQIIVSQPTGLLSPSISGTYNMVANTSPSAFTFDAGTMVFLKLNSLSGGMTLYQFIFRQNNTWKQGVFTTGFNVPPNNFFLKTTKHFQ